MREMTKDEQVLYNILKNDPNCRKSNYEAVRKFYKEVYGIYLPIIPRDMPSIWTVERSIRTLKSTYPKELTDTKEREIKAEMVDRYKEMALDENKPVKPKEMAETVNEQGSLGLFGEPMWW